MPRARGEKDYLSLLMGLNTEANPLAFPEGYTTDELNFLLDKSGDVRIRRKGLENSASDQSYTSANELPLLAGAYYWQDLDVILMVISTLNDEVVLRVHRNDASFTFVDEHVIDPSAGASYIPSFSPILSGLVITGSGGVNYVKPVLLQKNSSGDIDIYSTQLYFRDFDLIDDSLSVSTRPATLTDEHTYNLYNAGWYAERKNSSGEFVDPLSLFEGQIVTYNVPTTFTSPNIFVMQQVGIQNADLNSGDTVTITGSVSNDGTYTVFSVDRATPNQLSVTTIENTIVNEATITVAVKGEQGGIPSNADIPVLGLKVDSNGDEIFSADTLFETVVGSTEAPRGHYIFDIEENRTRDDVLTTKQTDGSVPSTITFEATIAL